jgi:hypothetical protein
MPRSALRTVAHALPATVLLLGMTGSSTTSSETAPPSSPSQAPSRQAATGQMTRQPSEGNTAMHIRLTIDGHSVDAALNDGATAREFAALLPLTLGLDDFQQTERVADLPGKLSADGAPASSDPKAGDLAFYAPWGSLALFYRDGHPSPGLVILGRLTDRDDVTRLATADRVRIQAGS